MKFFELKEAILEDRAKSSPCYDLVVNTSTLEYEVRDNLSFLKDKSGKLGSFQLTEWAHQQLCSKLSIPLPYIERCPSGLKESNLNYFLKNSNRDLKFRVINNNTVRAVLTDTYDAVDDYELINLIEPIFVNRDNINIVSYYKNDRLTSIRAIYEEGDSDIATGFVINNSEVGYLAVQLRGFIYRFSCSNGLITTKKQAGFHFRHRGDKSRLIESSRRAIVELDRNTLDIKKEFEGTLFYNSNVLEQIEYHVEGQKWPKKWAEHFIAAYNIEPNNSLFGLINAFTRGSQWLELTDRIQVEEFAASLL